MPLTLKELPTLQLRHQPDHLRVMGHPLPAALAAITLPAQAQPVRPLRVVDHVLVIEDDALRRLKNCDLQNEWLIFVVVMSTRKYLSS